MNEERVKREQIESQGQGLKDQNKEIVSQLQSLQKSTDERSGVQNE